MLLSRSIRIYNDAILNEDTLSRVALSVVGTNTLLTDTRFKLFFANDGARLLTIARRVLSIVTRCMGTLQRVVDFKTVVEQVDNELNTREKDERQS